MTTKQEARAFAIEVHGGQLYGKHPCSFHLDQVADIASRYGENAEMVCLAGLADALHVVTATDVAWWGSDAITEGGNSRDATVQHWTVHLSVTQ